ncbi:MAG: HAMP domain-containing sensor histidine kinase [Bermanella sp.]
MRIRNEIIIILVLFFGVLTISHYLFIKDMESNSTSRVYHHSLNHEKLLKTINLSTFHQAQLTSWKNILLIGHTTSNYKLYLSRFYHNERLLRTTVHDLIKDKSNSEAIQNLLIELKKNIKVSAKKQRKGLREFYETTSTATDIAEQFTKDEAILTSTIEKIRRLVAQQQISLLNQVNEDISTQLNFSFKTMLTIFLIASILLWLLIHWRIVNPMEKAIKVVSQVTRGDINQRMQVIGSLEIVKYASAFNDMLQKIETQNNQLEKVTYQLAHAEKLAALGSLVAGVAHELNTPLGIVLTASSSLGDATKKLQANFLDNKLTKTTFEEETNHLLECSVIIEKNIHRASKLINNFKGIAVDQSSEQKRSFKLNELLEKLMTNLQPQLKKSPHVIEICGEKITIISYPGLLSQVITHLVNNSILHGFNKIEQGLITIKLSKEGGERVKITYRDNGCGMSEEVQKHIYEPFYSTSVNGIGSGLGMNIVHNIVTGVLDGDIFITSQVNEYSQIILSLPIEVNRQNEYLESIKQT